MGNDFGMNDDDVENPFKEQSTRKKFIQKVYLTLFMQLLLTSGIVAVFVCVDAVAFYVHEHFYLKWIALGLVIVLTIILICCDSIRRSSPTNYICLLLFTLCNGFLLGIMASLYAPDEVLTSLGITGAVVLALTLFAMQKKIDFTPLYCIMLIISVVFLLFALVGVFFFRYRIMRIVIAAIGVTLFSIWLIIDTQMIMGGRRLAISTDEYIYAALQLYLDILMIFQYILILFSDSYVLKNFHCPGNILNNNLPMRGCGCIDEGKSTQDFILHELVGLNVGEQFSAAWLFLVSESSMRCLFLHEIFRTKRCVT